LASKVVIFLWEEAKNAFRLDFHDRWYQQAENRVRAGNYPEKIATGIG
jgi:hypothetical protein